MGLSPTLKFEMDATALKSFLKGLPPPQGVEKPPLDITVDLAIETAYKKVWGAHWWLCRQRYTELTTTASTEYVECPKDFGQGVLLGREGSSAGSIDVVSPKRFFADHPYPSGRSTGRPKEGTLIHDATRNPEFRIYLWPMPGDTYTLPILYLRKANVTEMESLTDEMIAAVVAAAKYQLGYITYEESVGALEEAIEQAGGFIMPPGRRKLEELDDLNNWSGANQAASSGPDWYFDVP